MHASENNRTLGSLLSMWDIWIEVWPSLVSVGICEVNTQMGDLSVSLRFKIKKQKEREGRNKKKDGRERIKKGK